MIFTYDVVTVPQSCVIKSSRLSFCFFRTAIDEIDELHCAFATIVLHVSHNAFMMQELNGSFSLYPRYIIFLNWYFLTVGEGNTGKECLSSATREEIPLVLLDGEYTPEAEHHYHQSQKAKPTLKLLLYRSIFFLVGVVLLIAGGVASQYHPSADYSDCDGSNSSDNLNISSDYYSHYVASSAEHKPQSLILSVVPTSIVYVLPTGVPGSSLSLHPSNVPF